MFIKDQYSVLYKPFINNYIKRIFDIHGSIKVILLARKKKFFLIYRGPENFFLQDVQVFKEHCL